MREVLELLGADGEHGAAAQLRESVRRFRETIYHVRARRRRPIGTLVADVGNPEPCADFVGHERDPHRKWVGGIEYKVGFLAEQKVGQRLSGEAAPFDGHQRVGLAEQIGAGFFTRHGRADGETGFGERLARPGPSEVPLRSRIFFLGGALAEDVSMFFII